MNRQHITWLKVETHLELLCDIEVFLSLIQIIPMLEIVQGI
jgi:hypothetical protein